MVILWLYDKEDLSRAVLCIIKQEKKVSISCGFVILSTMGSRTVLIFGNIYFF
jgi:hypothetical protein